MKKSFICFLAGAVAAVLVFTGCQTAEEKAVAKYKTALVKGREMESYTTAGNVDMMAASFKNAIIAGRMAFLAKTGRVLENKAEASSPLTGFLED